MHYPSCLLAAGWAPQVEDETPLGAEYYLVGSTGEGDPTGFAGSHPVARAAGGVLAVAERVPLFF